MKHRAFLPFVLIAIALFSAEALSAETITWYQPNFPPYVIVNGDQQVHGVDNQIVQTMIQNLPDSVHSFDRANYKRILQNLKGGKTGIITPLFRTPEREAYIHYSSIPSYLVFPNGFIYNKAQKERYEPFLLEDGTLDVEAMCRSKLFVIGVNSGRSYSGVLDDAIKRHEKGHTFFKRTATDHIGVLKMVAHNRIDAAFGFPVEIAYAELGDQLGFFPVAGMDQLLPVYFGSSKNEQGIRLIQKLETILREKDPFDQFAEMYSYWLDDSMQAEYEQRRQAYYKTCETRCIDQR